MSNTNETIADIRLEAEAEFRDLLGRSSVIISHMQIMQKFNRFFDRIEAAARRERKAKRNCDVGTADEQAKRFEEFCLKHIGCAEETGGRHCIGCPLEKASMHITQKCELYWAQMPYEKQEGCAK